MIRNIIVDHLERNNILPNAQHGFRSKRNCITNLLAYLDDIIDAVDGKECVDVIYLVVKKHSTEYLTKGWSSSWIGKELGTIYSGGSRTSWLTVPTD